jgi:hypothetical protein
MQERHPTDVTMRINAAREIELIGQRLAAWVIPAERIVGDLEGGINET